MLVTGQFRDSPVVAELGAGIRESGALLCWLHHASI